MIISAILIILFTEFAAGFHSDPFEYHHVTGFERGSRFITFNNDASNIRLEMVFAIPFLQIPIGASQQQGLRPTVDVNLKSLIVAGMIFFVLFFIVPGIIRVTIPNSGISRGWESSDASRILERMETTLSNIGVDTNACWQQGVCYVLENAKENVSKGQASSWEKIISGISTNNWMTSIIPQQFLPSNCASNYTCPITRYNFMDLLSHLNYKHFSNINLG